MVERVWHKDYPVEVPYSYEYPRLPLKDYFTGSAKAHPDRAFLIYRNREMSYREANTQARKLAQGLLRLGCKKADRVAIVANNIPEFIISVQACYKIGAIVVTANPFFTTRELEHILSDSGTETIIVIDRCLDKIQELKLEGKVSAKRIIVISTQQQELSVPEGIPSPEVLNYADLIANNADVEPAIEVSADDCAVLQYTGGTTGVPKGCVVSNANLESAIYGWSTWYTLPLPAGQYPVILNPLPLYHIYGLIGNIGLASYSAGTILLLDSLSLESIVEAIEEYQPNLLCVVPSLLVGLVHYPGIKDVNLDSLVMTGVGGDSLPEVTKLAFEALSGVPVIVGYGLSETAGSVCGQPLTDKTKAASIGVPLPDVEIRIMSLDDRLTEMPTGELGELAIRGPQVVSSYWNRPEESELSFVDGWLYTGDIGLMDEEGWFYIKERKKDLIISGGFNVYPKEIDDILYSHPSIREACTVGIPDEAAGELIVSFIVLRPDQELSEEKVKEFCREYLAAYKIPRRVRFLDKLPKTSVGKPSRVALRKHGKPSLQD